MTGLPGLFLHIEKVKDIMVCLNFVLFIHIIRNLEEGYQGLIHLPNNSKENYLEIVQLNSDIIFDKNNNKIINPSNIALLC